MSTWPEEARVAAIAAVDKRAMKCALDISVNDTWLLVTDILNAVAPLIAGETLRNATREQAEAAMREVMERHMRGQVGEMVRDTTGRVMDERLATTEALIRASERARIRQLAIDHDATYGAMCSDHAPPFADLLREDS